MDGRDVELIAVEGGQLAVSFRDVSFEWAVEGRGRRSAHEGPHELDHPLWIVECVLHAFFVELGVKTACDRPEVRSM